PRNSTSSRSTPGNAENGASRSISAIESRQVQSPPGSGRCAWISRVQPRPLRQRSRRYWLAVMTRDMAASVAAPYPYPLHVSTTELQPRVGVAPPTRFRGTLGLPANAHGSRPKKRFFRRVREKRCVGDGGAGANALGGKCPPAPACGRRLL